MNTKIVYKVISPADLGAYKQSLLNLIDPDNLRSDEILKSLENSNIIILTLDGKKVIGSNQVITDMYFSALLINLVVDPEYRKLGIGANIVKKTLDKLIELEIKNIDLVADPGSPWLVDFYGKYGFELGEKSGTYMHLNKKIYNQQT